MYAIRSYYGGLPIIACMPPAKNAKRDAPKSVIRISGKPGRASGRSSGRASATRRGPSPAAARAGQMLIWLAALLLLAGMVDVGRWFVWPDVAALATQNPGKTAFMRYREAQWEREGKAKRVVV